MYYVPAGITCAPALHSRWPYVCTGLACLPALRARWPYMHAGLTCPLALRARWHYVPTGLTCPPALRARLTCALALSARGMYSTASGLKPFFSSAHVVLPPHAHVDTAAVSDASRLRHARNTTIHHYTHSTALYTLNSTIHTRRYGHDKM